MAANQDLAYADTLWKTADALRGQIDAAEYKHVVLGLLFLKYISNSFKSRRDELRQELQKDGITGPNAEPLLESRDEYLAERVFWVPPESRWPNLQNQATRPDIATLIDDAIRTASCRRTTSAGGSATYPPATQITFQPSQGGKLIANPGAALKLHGAVMIPALQR
jgi:hypothetical protein